jgi:hypothetical protein
MADVPPETNFGRELVVEARNLATLLPPTDRSRVADALVDYFVGRGLLDDAVEVAVQLDGSANAFSRIALRCLDASDFNGALRVAELAQDSTARDRVLAAITSRMAQSRRTKGGIVVAARISDRAARIDALTNAAQSMYPRDSSALPYLLGALDLLRGDTTAAWRRDNLAFLLLELGDWRGVHLADSAGRTSTERVLFLGNLAGRLRDRNNERVADSLDTMARAIATAGGGDGAALWRAYWGNRHAGAADSAFVLTLGTIEDASAGNQYLARVAQYYVQKFDMNRPRQIAELLLARGDTNSALTVLANLVQRVASSRQADSRTHGVDLWRILQELRRISAVSERWSQSGHAGNAVAAMSRADLPRVRELVADSGLQVLGRWGHSQFIATLMGVDIHAAISLALQLEDTAQRDYQLRIAAERQSGAGYGDDALRTMALIGNGSVRAQATLSVARQRVQNGDTTGVRAMVLEAMPNLDATGDSWTLSYHLSALVGRLQLFDEARRWLLALPENLRALAMALVASRLSG